MDNTDLIYKWVDDSLEGKDITDYQVTPKFSGKGGGYVTEPIFVKIKGKNKSNGEKVDYDLVYKVSRVFKNQIGNELAELYKKEIVVYDKVFPEFRQFIKGTKVSEVFDSIPTAFNTLVVDNRCIVILENLGPTYLMHDRTIGMNSRHIEIVLRNYAKFHAISYAFKDQKPQEFERLFSDYYCTYKSFCNSQFKMIFQPRMVMTREKIKKVDEDLAKKVDFLIQKNVNTMLDEILNDNVENSIITHGDCWGGNFLFTYDNDDRTSPKKVAILDWQLSSRHSPAMDLSYFLFTVASAEQMNRLDEILKFYYDNLAEAIRELGSDPEKVFTFSQFYEQWRKYSGFGLAFSVAFLQSMICDVDQAVGFEDYSDTEELMNAIAAIGADDDGPYLERMVPLLKYYFKMIGI